MKLIIYCSSIQKDSHIQMQRYPKYLDSFVLLHELSVLVLFLYIKLHLFQIEGFTGISILTAFGELQSGLMANVIHNTWNGSESTDTHTHTHKEDEMLQRSHMFSLSIPWAQTFAMEYNNALDSQQKFVSKGRKTKSSAAYCSVHQTKAVSHTRVHRIGTFRSDECSFSCTPNPLLF